MPIGGTGYLDVAERPAVFLEHTRNGIRALGKRHRRTRLVNEFLYCLMNTQRRKSIKIYFREEVLTACYGSESLQKSASSIRAKSGVFSWKAQTLVLSG